MRARVATALVSVLTLAAAVPASAASLQVSPVSIEIATPASTATVTLRNEGSAPLNAQIRVFKWSQVDGKERLEPTTDIVASPPMATLGPKADYLVRLVRLSKAPAAQEETYRILVDEVPEMSKQRSGVNITMRYSIPVFIEPKQLGGAKLTWSAVNENGKVVVKAINDGDRRVRISELKAIDAAGAMVSFGNGLNGYVLARSSTQWVAPSAAMKSTNAGSITITAKGDAGPINAKTSSSASR